eukprot:13677420-Ditylum_brightwellii.AAC.1
MERSKIVSPDKAKEANEDEKFCVGQRTERHVKPREPESKEAEPRELCVRKETTKLTPKCLVKDQSPKEQKKMTLQGRHS